MIIRDPDHRDQWTAIGVTPTYGLDGELSGYHVESGNYDQDDLQSIADSERVTVRDYRGHKGSLEGIYWPEG